MGYARDGDIVVVHSLDRLARNLDDFRKIVQTLNAQETKVYFLKENLLFTPFNFGGGLGGLVSRPFFCKGPIAALCDGHRLRDYRRA